VADREWQRRFDDPISAHRMMSLYHPKRYKLSFAESPTRTDIASLQNMKTSSVLTSADDKSSWFRVFEPTQQNLAHVAASRERAMPLFDSHQRQNDRGIRWRGIAATAMVELLVLFALAFAVVRYVEWSSAVNLAEFMSATNPSSVANHSGEFSTRALGPQGASRLRSERVELLTLWGSPGRIHSRTCVYRKSKSERIDDEVRPVWRANLW
jgi:hypothetical protein